jgi:hypothetical protein
MAPWCGDVGEEALFLATLNPCYFSTAAALVLSIAALAVALLSGASARRLASAATGRSYLLPRFSAAVAHTQALAAGVLIALHGFALVWSTTQVPQPPYVEFTEALLLTAWSLFLVSQTKACSRERRRTAWRPGG